MFRSHRSAAIGSWKPIPLYVLPGLLLMVLAMLVSTCQAQQLTGTLSGTAYDQTGAVIPKAKVVLKNEASGDIRTTFADSVGYFSLTAVPPASYTVTVSAAGFTTWQEPGIVMSQGDSRSLPNIRLKVGGKTTDVEVISGADAIVPVDTAEISTTLNQQMVSDISLSGRDAGELLKIMPGMAQTNGLSNQGSFNGKVTGTNNGPVGSFSANGTQPNGAMAFMLDGANLVDPGNAGSQLANINQDMTAEVKVLMSSYGAEYAKGPVIFQAFSKSGGTHYHGEGYFYARNSALNAWDAYAKSQYASTNGTNPALAATLHPDEHYYYVGGNVGGPILIPGTHFNSDRKKLFFWAGYEYMNQHPAANPINYNVPTQAQLSGDFTNPGVPQGAKDTWGYAYYSPNNNLPAGATSSNIPTSSFDPNIVGLLASGAYPKTNITPSATNGWNNYQYVNASPQNRWEVTAKLDYAINDNTKITGSYSRQIEKDLHPITIWWSAPWQLPYPSNASANTVSQLYLTNFTHVFNPTTTNEFVFTLAKYINPSTLDNPKAVDRTHLGFNVAGLFGHTTSQIPNLTAPWGGAFPTLGQVSFAGTYNGGGAFGATKKDPAFYDNFTKVITTHTIKTGFYWDTSENVQSSSANDNGNYNLGWGQYGTGNVVADFLLGRPGNYQQQSSIPVDDIKMHQWSIYAQDQWKATKQLTLNYGLRFDHMGQWFNNSFGMQVWNPATYVNDSSAGANTGLQWHAKDPSIPQSGFVSPTFYYEPRLGFAYDVFGNGKTVVRGGFAIFRYQLSVNDVSNPSSAPEGSFTYTTPTGFKGYAGISQFTPPSGTTQNGSSVNAMKKGDNKTPQTADWNFTVSQALPKRIVFEISYVANKSTNELINGNNGKYMDINNINPNAFFGKDPTDGKYYSPAYDSNAAWAAGYSPINTNHYRPLVNYQDVYIITHGSYSSYNSLQVSAQKQSGPVTFLANYTFSKLLGIRDGNTSNGAGNGSTVDPFVLTHNYGVLAYDHTQLFNFAYVWNLPKVVHSNGVLAEMVNGWQLSGYTTLQKGAPLQPNLGGGLNPSFSGSLPDGTIKTSTDGLNQPVQTPYELITLPQSGLKTNAITSSTYFGTNAPPLLPLVTCDPRKGLSKGQFFNPKCFTVPAYGQQGTYNWPYVRGPAYINNDLAIFKNFRLTENQKIQFRLQATNFINHPLAQFGLAGNGDQSLSFVVPGNLSQSNPAAGGSSPTNTNTTTTGKPAFETGARNLTFAVKYFF